MPTRKTAFTLVELMVVVAVIGLLASIAVYSFSRAREASWRTVCIRQLHNMAGAKEQAALELNWPADAGPSTLGNPYYKDTISTYLDPEIRPFCPTGPECYYMALTEDPICNSGLTGHVYSATSP